MAGLLEGRRVAVIGATGFIGSHLVERMSAAGARVLSVARSPHRLNNLSSVRGDHSFALGDVIDAQGIERLLTEFRPQVIHHLAAHPDGPESPAQMGQCMRINTLGVLNVLQVAQSIGTEVFVLADSCKVYGNGEVPYHARQAADPLCSYAVAKAAAWQLCRLIAAISSVQVVGLRLTFVYGARQNWNLIRYVEQCVVTGQPIRLQGGAQTRDPLYIDHAVDALVAAATRPAAFGWSIPIGGGAEIVVTDLCRQVLAAMGAETEIVENAEAPRLTETWRSVADNSEARMRLGWSPRTGLTEGLAKTVNRAPSRVEVPRRAVIPGRVA